MNLPPERAGVPANAELAARRAAMRGAVEAGYFCVDPPAEELTLGGVRALRFAPPVAPRATIIHFHGGGYRIGSPETVSRFARALADQCSVTVICPAYRLAPEHPFPAALHDAWRVFAALSGAPIILSGDSAGGGIASALTALAHDQAQPPKALLLFSAWLDLTLASSAYDANAATDPLFSRASAAEAGRQYLQGAPAAHPLASPALASPTGFPPTFISCGAGEVLVDDSRGFHAALTRVGVRAQLDIVDGMEHVAVTRDFNLTGARHTFDAACAFLNARLPT